MITITRTDKGKEHTIAIKGHAHMAEPGQDIVCAAVSVLLWTLYSNVKKHSEDYKADIKPGDAVITAYDDGMSIFYDTIMEGFRWLEQNYPTFVKIS